MSQKAYLSVRFPFANNKRELELNLFEVTLSDNDSEYPVQMYGVELREEKKLKFIWSQEKPEQDSFSDFMFKIASLNVKQLKWLMDLFKQDAQNADEFLFNIRKAVEAERRIEKLRKKLKATFIGNDESILNDRGVDAKEVNRLIDEVFDNWIEERDMSETYEG